MSQKKPRGKRDPCPTCVQPGSVPTDFDDMDQLIFNEALEGEGGMVYQEIPPTLKVPIPHYELDDYKIKEMHQAALFKKMAKETSQDQVQVYETKEDETAILKTGFGMRNLSSFQKLLEHEERRLYELYLKQQKEFAQQEKTPSTSSGSTVKKSEDKGSETVTEKQSEGDARLQYLLGIEQEIPEEYVPFEEPAKEEPDFVYSSSLSMRKAQKYLRVHRIFDFFQFIIAHLLAATPENPISFILELLNKCLLYRSGAAVNPPTLFDRQHFEQLFNLMDRMNTGYIDMEQYKQAMKTFGICAYNDTPEMENEGITKETFIEEVDEAQLALFIDLIQRKTIDRVPKKHEFQPIKYQIPRVREKKSTYFMPPDLFKKREVKKNHDAIQEE